MSLFRSSALLYDVLQTIGQPGGGGQAIASRTAGFLVITFNRFGQIDMRNKAHVGLVYANAERNGCHHDHAFLAKKTRQTGRASWRERVCQTVKILMVAVSLKKNN